MMINPDSTFAADQIDRRTGPASGLHVDPDTLTVRHDGQRYDVEWSPQEFTLLRLLYERRGQSCSHGEIIAVAWGSADPTYGRAHVHELVARVRHKLVARVRRKLEPDPSRPVYLLTRPGRGYVLLDRPAESEH